MSEVLRFTATERALHWGFAVTWLALLATGLPMTVPALQGLIRGYSPVVGYRLHLAAAVLWLAVTAVVVALGNRPRLRATWAELRRMGPDDWRWLRGFPRWLLSRGARARLDGTVGRFNGGQKVNALFTVASAALLAVTGAALLVAGAATFPYWQAAHRWLTLLALAAVAGHVYLALAHPPTRAALPGMLGGRVDAAWAASHHRRWRPDDREAA